MNVEPDLYAVLGVARTAPADEITRAYHRLVRHHHPDAHPEATPSHQALQDVLEAYAVLRDPVRRADYDRRTDAAHRGDEARRIDRARRADEVRRGQPRPRRRASTEEFLIRVGPVRYHGRRS